MGYFEENLAAWGREADHAVAERDRLAGEIERLSIDAALDRARISELETALAECRASHPEPEPIAEWVRGTWVLDQIDQMDTPRGTEGWLQAKTRGIDQGMETPGVIGVSIRSKWSTIEPSKGVYDFSIWDAVRAAYPGRKMSVRFMAGKHTPAWWKGNSYVDNGTAVPKPWNVDGTAGNRVFEEGWRKIVAAVTAWSQANDVRLIHLSQYGFEWAELFNGDEQKTAWRADFGADQPTGIGSTYNLVVINAHKRLLDIARTVLPNGCAYEFPFSGYGVNEVNKPIIEYAAATFTDQQLVAQSNCWAGPYRCGRPALPDSYMFGYQSYAVAGPTNLTMGSKGRNTLTWSSAYLTHPDSVALRNANYAEVYRETFGDPTDRAAIAAVIAP